MSYYQDIRTNEDSDLYYNVFDGDFEFIYSENQHISDILQSFMGDWKQWVMVGVGLSSYLNSVNQQQRLVREIIIQLRADGYTVDNPLVKIDGNSITVNPNAYRQ